MRLVAGMKRSRALHEGLVTAPGDDAATGGDDRALALHEQASRTQPTVWDAMGHDKGWLHGVLWIRPHGFTSPRPPPLVLVERSFSCRLAPMTALKPSARGRASPPAWGRSRCPHPDGGSTRCAVVDRRGALHPQLGGREGGRARHRLLPRRRRELQPDAKQAAESPESPAAEAVEQAAPGHRERRPGTIGRDAAEGIGPWGSVVPHDPDPAMRQVASDENDSTGSGLLNRIGGEVRPEPSSSGMQTRTGSMDRRQGTPEEPRNREPAH